MPIYEYHCKKCDRIFEELQGFNDKPLKKCRECGGKVERLISLSAFHLKGSGWYETEYGKKKTLKTVDNSSSNGSAGTDNAEASPDASGAGSPESTHESIKKETEQAKQKTKSN